MRSNPRLLIAAVILILGVVSYYSKRQHNDVTGETQHISLSTDQEIALGLNSAPEMESEMGGADPDPQAQALVQSIGEKVVAGSDARNTPYKYQFHLLADPNTINAFALPGGPVFITRGLLNRLENEAQLGGVLGHEVGHVVARHAAEHIAKSQLGQSIVGAVGVASSDNYGRGQQAAMIAALVAQMAQLRYGRNDELEADKLGVRFMSQAGYDPPRHAGSDAHPGSFLEVRTPAGVHEHASEPRQPSTAHQRADPGRVPKRRAARIEDGCCSAREMI